MAVVILYGSEGGTSELVADNIADVLGDYGDTSLYDMMEFDAGDLDPENFHVIVCSTYGEGELPPARNPSSRASRRTNPTSPVCSSRCSASATRCTRRPTTAAARSSRRSSSPSARSRSANTAGTTVQLDPPEGSGRGVGQEHRRGIPRIAPHTGAATARSAPSRGSVEVAVPRRREQADAVDRHSN